MHVELYEALERSTIRETLDDSSFGLDHPALSIQDSATRLQHSKLAFPFIVQRSSLIVAFLFILHPSAFILHFVSLPPSTGNTAPVI